MSNSSDEVSGRVGQVLFVCTANISRSPYAQWRAQQATSGSVVVFDSAGIPGTQNRSMDSNMLCELARRGVDGDAHRSRPVSTELVEASDVIITMEFGQHMRLLEAWSQASDRTFGLRQLAEAVRAAGTGGNFRDVDLANSMVWDIADPYGQGAGAARACAREIDELLGIVLPVLTGAPCNIVPLSDQRRRRWWQA